MQRIEVTISHTGDTKVEAIGCAGAGCSQLTAAIERAIGKTTSDVKKPEFLASQPMMHGAAQAGTQSAGAG